MASIGQLVREGFVKIPDVMAGCVLGAVGLGIGTIGLIKKNQQDVLKPYKHHYIVVREDHPRAAAYKQFYESQKK